LQKYYILFSYYAFELYFLFDTVLSLRRFRRIADNGTLALRWVLPCAKPADARSPEGLSAFEQSQRPDAPEARRDFGASAGILP
jgi:hypothetical protein